MKSSLKQWPEHTKAKENLELVKKMLEQQKQKTLNRKIPTNRMIRMKIRIKRKARIAKTTAPGIKERAKTKNPRVKTNLRTRKKSSRL